MKLCFNTYKSETIEGLAVGIVARDEKFLLPEFQLFAAFEPIKKMCGCILIQGKITNCTINSWLYGMYGECSVPLT
jgi:hypothetical protein